MCSFPQDKRFQWIVASTVLFTSVGFTDLSLGTAFAQERINTPVLSPIRHSLHLAINGEQPRPLAMVSGDFDEDGVADLVIGYGTVDGGSIAFIRGNREAIAPKTQAGWLAATKGEYVDAFQQSSKAIVVKVEPSLMVSADVDGDGHLDLVYATKGSSQLQVMFGTGKGTFSPKTASITVPGSIATLSSYRPGMPWLGEAITVGAESSRGNTISIVGYGASGLETNATYRLPGAPSMLAVAQLDSDFVPDTAIVAGGQLLVLHGLNAINGRGRLETLPLSGVQSVAAGAFFFDRHLLPQLSVLTSGGEVTFLAHQGFNPQPYTPEEIAAARKSQMHGAHALTLAQQAGDNGSEPWVEIERHSEPQLAFSGPGTPIMLRSRMSGSGSDDLVVLNPSRQQQVTISHKLLAAHTSAAALNRSQGNPFSASRLSLGSIGSSDIVAALPMRVNADGRQGLVILNADNLSPDITLPHANNTFFVNTFTDNAGSSTDPIDSVRCTSGNGEQCTLRDAITYANQDATDNGTSGSDTIILQAGTYTLTFQHGVEDANTNLLTHLEILGSMTIMGSTSGGGTIINAGQNDTVFTINPGPFGSYNPSGDSYLFDATLENLTIENGKNTNNINNNGLANNVGGAINWDAFGSGNLTLSNVIVKNNSVEWGPGGGIWAENSSGGGSGTLTITGSTISNNSTPEQGGGIYIASAPTGLSITNSTISSNTASVNVNLSDTGGSDGVDDGGAIYITERPTPSGTPASTISGSTISSNTANGAGGAIATFAQLTLTTSVLSGNSATFATSAGQSGSPEAYEGGAIYSNIANPELTPSITSTNFLGNHAYTSGGAIAVGNETALNGNGLGISLSRIFGNTSTNGVSGLASGEPTTPGGGTVTATNNWWGCNFGPSVSGHGCDLAAQVASSNPGTLAVLPYAEFLFSATSSTTIAIGGSVNLSLTLNTNSSSASIPGAFPAVNNSNYPYSFALTGVTGNAIPNGTFSSTGTGSATLTPTSTGAGTISATFDGQTDQIGITVNTVGTSLAFAPSSPSYTYGQPSAITVQLTPTNATGITAGNFAVTVDGASSLNSVAFGLTLVSGTEYQLTGPFNLVSVGGHTLKVNFLGTTNYTASNMSVPLTVGLGSASVGGVVSPPNPIQGVGGSVLVTVSPTGTGATPTGTVSYAFDGGTASAVSLSSGTASIVIPAIIAAGNHSLALTYNGDPNYGTATNTVSFTVYGRSQTTFASLNSSSATIDVLGFGFTAPSGQLAFTDTTSSNPVAAPVTLNPATATTALAPQVTTSTGTNSLPDWTELGDLNGDGKLDLVTSLFQTDSVSVQLGNGDGTFQAATTVLIAAGFGPAESHLVSLRGNGTLDLIVASFNVNQIAVLLGNGNGTFQPPAFYTVGSSSNTPTSLTTGDFNHDGHLDVAVANTKDNTISILLGNSSGTLTASGTPISVGHDPEAIRAGDFNADGYSDLAVANYRDGTVTTLLNNQNGTFTATTISVGSGVNSGPQALAIVGSGGSLQLAVANYRNNTVSVLKSNGNGTFGAQTIVAVGRGPDDVSFADFNGDGFQDLVVSNYTDGSVDLLLGSSGGSYTLVGPFTVGNNPYSAVVGDLDLDGTPDVVVSNCFSNNTGVLRSGKQISVPYTGLSMTPGDTLHAVYTPDGASKYGTSTSASVTAP